MCFILRVFIQEAYVLIILMMMKIDKIISAIDFGFESNKIQLVTVIKASFDHTLTHIDSLLNLIFELVLLEIAYDLFCY